MISLCMSWVPCCLMPSAAVVACGLLFWTECCMMSVNRAHHSHRRHSECCISWQPSLRNVQCGSQNRQNCGPRFWLCGSTPTEPPGWEQGSALVPMSDQKATCLPSSSCRTSTRTKKSSRESATCLRSLLIQCVHRSLLGQICWHSIDLCVYVCVTDACHNAHSRPCSLQVANTLFLTKYCSEDLMQTFSVQQRSELVKYFMSELLTEKWPAQVMTETMCYVIIPTLKDAEKKQEMQELLPEELLDLVFDTICKQQRPQAISQYLSCVRP